ncbi:O-antigen ligase family protein [Sphingomonas arenae]|uniref:O-antigen ligase family protein n=1 Tax=Sphingomonas arenae TaxID=2812555 RepID=UPI001967EE95|nr:O-antigen ligase family protein [Sphingomonas arenae]
MQPRAHSVSATCPNPSPAGAIAPASPLERLEFLCAQAAVFLAPYLILRTPGAYLTVSDMLMMLVFFFRLCTGRLSRPFGDFTWLWIAGAALLIGGLMLGTVVNGDMNRGLEVFGQYGFALILVPLALLGRPVDQVVQLMRCAIWGMAIMCALGIAIFLTGYRSDGSQVEFVTGNGRLAGFVENPNGMAVLVVLAFPLVWFLLASRQIGRLAGFAAMGVLLAGLLLTASNTGLLGLALALLVFFVGRRSFRTLVSVAVVGGALFFIGQQYMPLTFQHRVLGALTSGDIDQAGTFAYRRELAREAWSKVEDHIVIGLGADHYRVVSDLGHIVHNTYLLLLAEGGALALFGLLALFAAALLTVLTSSMRPFGSLVTLTTFTVLVVFANLLNGIAHVYGRCWWISLLLAVGPAVAKVPRPVAMMPVRLRSRPRTARPRAAVG